LIKNQQPGTEPSIHKLDYWQTIKSVSVLHVYNTNG